MPTWLFVAFWAFWTIIAFDELRTLITLYDWNKNPIRIGLRGRASRNWYGRLSLYGFVVFTVIWFSWVLFH